MGSQGWWVQPSEEYRWHLKSFELAPPHAHSKDRAHMPTAIAASLPLTTAAVTLPPLPTKVIFLIRLVII
jgi:hypothetical protein